MKHVAVLHAVLIDRTRSIFFSSLQLDIMFHNHRVTSGAIFEYPSPIVYNNDENKNSSKVMTHVQLYFLVSGGQLTIK